MRRCFQRHGSLDFHGPRSLWERAYVFEAVAIEQPRLRLAIRRDAKFNLDDLTPRMRADFSDTLFSPTSRARSTTRPSVSGR